jgi:Holliday junction resolvase RusA-like endonuclease
VSITIDIIGDPKPGGSKRFLGMSKAGRAIIADDAKHNADWKTSVRVQACSQYRGQPLAGELEVQATLYKARPRGHFNSKGEIKAKHRASLGPSTRPDATKLWRSTEDALTGILWYDDAQIVTQTQMKRWADGRAPGCVVVVGPAREHT